jgi:hypothetical protein
VEGSQGRMARDGRVAMDSLKYHYPYPSTPCKWPPAGGWPAGGRPSATSLDTPRRTPLGDDVAKTRTTGKRRRLVTDSHRREARGGHGAGPPMADPSTSCGRATPETALQPFLGWPARRAGGLMLSSTVRLTEVLYVSLLYYVAFFYKSFRNFIF